MYLACGSASTVALPDGVLIITFSGLDRRALRQRVNYAVSFPVFLCVEERLHHWESLYNLMSMEMWQALELMGQTKSDLYIGARERAVLRATPTVSEIVERIPSLMLTTNDKILLNIIFDWPLIKEVHLIPIRFTYVTKELASLKLL